MCKATHSRFIAIISPHFNKIKFVFFFFRFQIFKAVTTDCSGYVPNMTWIAISIEPRRTVRLQMRIGFSDRVALLLTWLLLYADSYKLHDIAGWKLKKKKNAGTQPFYACIENTYRRRQFQPPDVSTSSEQVKAKLSSYAAASIRYSARKLSG